MWCPVEFHINTCEDIGGAGYFRKIASAVATTTVKYNSKCRLNISCVGQESVNSVSSIRKEKYLINTTALFRVVQSHLDKPSQPLFEHVSSRYGKAHNVVKTESRTKNENPFHQLFYISILDKG